MRLVGRDSVSAADFLAPPGRMTRWSLAWTGRPRPNTAAITRRSPPAFMPRHGLDVTIQEGGPQVNHTQLLLAGPARFQYLRPTPSWR